MSATDGKIEDHAGRVIELLMEVRYALLRGHVVEILRAGMCAGALRFEGLAGVVDRLAPHKGVQQVEPLSAAMLDAGLEAVVISERMRPRDRDRAKGRIRPARKQ